MKVLINRLNVQTMVLDLAKPLEQIPPMAALAAFNCRLMDDVTLEVDINREQSINELFFALSQQNIIISSMRNKTNRLEQLFMHLVTANKSKRS
jgi:ABC-2 type transport system ATP-binding protein